MTKDYILIIISVLLLALNFAATKAYQKDKGSGLAEGIKFNALLGEVTAVLFFAINGFGCKISPFSAVMAAAAAILTAAYTLFGFKIMENGSMALYMIFLMTGGMTVPYIWGLLFLDEPLSLLRTAGLIVIAVSIVISNKENGKSSTKLILMCTAIFILNGFTSVVSKEHQISASAVPAMDFLILNSAAKAIICTALYLFIRKGKTTGSKRTKSGITYILAAAAAGGGSYLLQLIGAENLPATVLYPMVTGGTIIFTAAAGRAFFGEKPGKRMIIGIIICFIGTCMFL
ncbi:MAG: EamA family transporter [Clostridia bacterium]|nr:EamA family transporter [Clostridia bacterium]